MTLPTLHVAHKDSPQTVLAVAIDDTETTLVLDDTSIFEVDNVTRLTLGIDTPVTETITVVSYEGGPSGDMDIIVTRGNPAYIWPEGTLVARVFTSYDLDEVHEYLEELNDNMVTNGDTHDHAGGDGAQIPTAGIVDANVTADKLAADAVTTAKILDANVTAAKLAADAVTTAKILDANVTAAKLGADAVTTVKILADAVTHDKIPRKTRQIFLPVYKYLDPADPNSVSYRPWSTSPHFGVNLPADKFTSVGASGIIPADKYGSLKIKPVIFTFLGATTGYHMYIRYEINIGSLGERIDSETNLGEEEFLGQVEVLNNANSYHIQNPPWLELSMQGIGSPGDIMSVEFYRDGENVLDTYVNTLTISGFIVSYTADY